MIRKTTAAVVLVGALALGTASATSLGDFGNPLFAASQVDLLGCQVPDATELLKLLPDLPEPDDDISGLTTLALSSLDVRPVTSALADLDDGVGDPCITDTVLDLVLVDASGVVLDIVQVDPDAASGLDAVSLTEVIDVTQVAGVRAVLRDAPPAP